MPPLPVITGREAVNVFLRTGWVLARQKGSHMILIKSGELITLSVPDHKTLDRGTLRSLIRKAGMTVDEFINLLK